VGGDDSIDKNKQRMTIPARIVATDFVTKRTFLTFFNLDTLLAFVYSSTTIAAYGEHRRNSETELVAVLWRGHERRGVSGFG